ncbi:MAG: T9SS type A sorting domain-containing protein, partial [Bacteroidia bacterium]
ATDTLYFDDFTGPMLNIAGVEAIEGLSGAQLMQNKPNPAQGSTRIDLQLEQAGPVSLKVYNMLGSSVATLLDGNMEPGSYSVPFETARLTNGIYFYELKTDRSSKILKMTVTN